MIDPPKPSKGMDVLAWCTRVWFFIRSIKPIAGPGLMMEQTSSGTVISARRATPSSDTPPFWVEQTTMDNGSIGLMVGSGRYQIGADQDFLELAKTEATEGKFAYLKINYDGTAPVVTVKVEAEKLDAIILSTAEPYTAIESNVLLGYVDDNDKLIHVMSGHMMITTWAINGVPAYWADSMGVTKNDNA